MLGVAEILRNFLARSLKKKKKKEVPPAALGVTFLPNAWFH